MKPKIGFTESEITLGFSSDASRRRTPSASADQRAPKNYYVYAHRRADGVIFYIGKGKGRRAWNDDRHILWHRYVEKYLKGQYSVQILGGLNRSLQR